MGRLGLNVFRIGPKGGPCARPWTRNDGIAESDEVLVLRKSGKGGKTALSGLFSLSGSPDPG